MGAEISKTLLLSKSFFNLLKLFLHFLFSCPYKNMVFDFLNFEIPICKEFLKFTIVPCGETKTRSYSVY